MAVLGLRRVLTVVSAPGLGLTLALSLVLGVGVVPAALGDPGDGGSSRSSGDGRAFPSQEQVDRAKARAARKAQDVGEIKARLLLADQRLEQAATQAEQASEAYNGAMWRLDQAKQRYREARGDAARARRTVATQRDRIGALVAQSYQQGGDLTALNAMMSADGPEGVLDQYTAFQGASTSLQADYQRFAAADSLAQVFESKAREAKAEQVRLAGKAKEAKDRAVTAADAAQQAATSIRAEKDQLIHELADAQHISFSLAQQRQTALEEIARKRAAERARREALAAAQARARAEAAQRARQQAAAAAAAKVRARQQVRHAHHATPGRRTHHRNGAPAPAPAPAPTPAPTPPPAAPPAPGGGADAAIGFAKAQLGEPYRWGATGPDSWDCSGLTMRAWAAGGKSLPHYSVAQYYAGTPISVGQLRRGDLVFWSSNGAPGGIHHVAMYIGDGLIIHAPRTGRPVEIDSMYYWIPPDFFVRV